MNPCYKVFFIVLLFPLFSSAQSNYKPGYLVTLKGDTLRGFIDYREWNNNPDAISFKKLPTDGKGQKYTPNEISFFNISGFESYKKYSGPISMDIVNTDHLTTGKDTSFKIGDVFLKVLQKGKNVALYAYNDNLKARYFIGDSPDFKPKELVYRIYLANNANGSEKTFIDETYLKQLNSLAIKYNALNDDLAHNLEKADYQKPALLLITSKINNLSKEEFKNKYDDQTASYFYGGNKYNFYLGSAVNITKTSPSSASPFYGSGGRAYTSYLPALLFGISVPADPNTTKLLFRGELSVSLAKYSSSYQNKVYPYVGVRASYNELGISFTPQMVYNLYNADNFKGYGGVGVALISSSYSNTYYGSQDASTTFIGDNNYDFITFDVKGLLKAGIQIQKKWEIYFNYLTPGAATNRGYFQLNKTNEQAGINYIF